LVEGLSVVSADDSALVDFSALEAFFELFFVPAPVEVPVASDGDSPLVPCIV